MSRSGSTVRFAAWPQLRAQVDPIREQVFVAEQGIPHNIVWDRLDASSVHGIVVEHGQAVGCCRLRRVDDCAKLERMAVLAAARGRGCGRVLLESALHWAREASLTAVVLHSQMTASGFYRRCGFRPVGEPFPEADILHLAMEYRFDDATEG